MMWPAVAQFGRAAGCTHVTDMRAKDRLVAGSNPARGTTHLLNQKIKINLAGGHSGGATPGLIPNPEVKPASDLGGTVFREGTGTPRRCQPFYCRNTYYYN